MLRLWCCIQRQTAVTAYLKSKQLLLFVFAVLYYAREVIDKARPPTPIHHLNTFSWIAEGVCITPSRLIQGGYMWPAPDTSGGIHVLRECVRAWLQAWVRTCVRPSVRVKIQCMDLIITAWGWCRGLCWVDNYNKGWFHQGGWKDLLGFIKIWILFSTTCFRVVMYCHFLELLKPLANDVAWTLDQRHCQR